MIISSGWLIFLAIFYANKYCEFRVKSLIKGKSLKILLFIYIFQILPLKVLGKILQELILLLKIKLILHQKRFLNIVVDFAFQLPLDVVAFGHLLKDFHVSGTFTTLLANVTDQVSNTVNVICHANTRNHLNKREADDLLPIGSNDVTKANSEHYGGAPVETPYVPFAPT